MKMMNSCIGKGTFAQHHVIRRFLLQNFEHIFGMASKTFTELAGEKKRKSFHIMFWYFCFVLLFPVKNERKVGDSIIYYMLCESLTASQEQ